MAFAYLNFPGRIWRLAGLNYLLYPQDIRNNVNLSGNPAKVEVVPVSGQGSSPRPKFVHPPAPEAKREKTPDPRVGSWKATPREAWPVQWQKQLGMSKKGRFAWTYMDLGNDLLSVHRASAEEDEELQTQRKQRGQCLRKLFADLAHPAGTHTFWPIALPETPDNGKAVVNAECFWSGLEHLQCRGVIIMGSAAAYAAMGTRDIRPLSQLFKFGKLVWILWDADVIYANPVVYNKVVVFLRRSLANFIRF